MRSLLVSSSFLSLAPCVLSALYTSPSQLPTLSYDYIVVGGGTAGSVIASRLTENASVTVLVLEAGVTNEGVQASIVPLLGPSLTPATLYDWNYTTTAQTGYNGRTVPYARGRLLGGSSSVNYMVYMRGSSADFDRYATVTGDSGWNWSNMQQFVPRHEKFVAPADNHNTAGEYTPSLHGYNGLLSVSLPGNPTPLDDRVIATTKEQAAEFPFNQDMVGGNVLGIGWAQSSIGAGQRSSSATAYLESGQISRSNLHVLIGAQVTKLVQNGTVGGVPSFHSVNFVTQQGGAVTTVSAKKEIVLSAGSIGTPTLLQLSGVGAKADLAALNIPTVIDNPSVGQNLSDHPLLATVYNVQGNQSYDGIFRDSALFGATLTQWQNNRTGPFAGGVANHLGFLRLPSNSSIFKTVKDPAAGPTAAHWEVLFSNLWVVPGVSAPASGSFMSVSLCLISPTSRGSLKLASADPFTKPLINPNFMATDFDIFALREAVKASRRFVAGAAWKDYVIGAYGDLANATTDAQIEAYIRANAATLFHPVGTASMSPKGAKWGVVDPDLKVKGAEGLRIVDGSVLPYAPNAHTQGPIYLVAERGAALIKAGQ